MREIQNLDVFFVVLSLFLVFTSNYASGFRNLMDLYLLHHGKSMPPTCMETTHPEMAFFSPELVPLVQDIEVLGPEWFATHRPVCFSIKIPTNGLMKKHIRFPRQFVELGLDENCLSNVTRGRFFSTPTWGDDPVYPVSLICFRWVETTN